jgi:hypothetical protein
MWPGHSKYSLVLWNHNRHIVGNIKWLRAASFVSKTGTRSLSLSSDFWNLPLLWQMSDGIPLGTDSFKPRSIPLEIGAEFCDAHY